MTDVRVKVGQRVTKGQSLENGVLTLTTDGGATVRISVGDSTTYHAQASATPNQVTAGQRVTVQLTPGARAFRGQAPSASAGPLGSATDVTIDGEGPAPS